MGIYYHKIEKMQSDAFIQTKDGIYLEIDSSSSDLSELDSIDRTHTTTHAHKATLKNDDSDSSSFLDVSPFSVKKEVSTKLG